MTNIEKHVTSLELSKKLKGLGIMQDSQFYWVLDSEFNAYLPTYNTLPEFERHDCYSAYLASELMEMLPQWIHHDTRSYAGRTPMRISHWNDRYSIEYHDVFEAPIYRQGGYPTLVEAIAQSLIWCIENGYWKPELISSKDKDNE